MIATMQDEQRRRSIPLESSQLPRAEAAEAALLDAALTEVQARDLALAMPAGAITTPAYQPILTLMKAMQADGLAPDRISLIEAARATGTIDCDALWDTMQEIDGASMHAGDAEPHAKIIRDRYEQRLMIQRVHATLERMVTTPEHARHAAQQLLSSMVEFAGEGQPGFVHAATAMWEGFDQAERRSRGDMMATITTGVSQLDCDPVGGVEPGDLISLVMVSGHGKTAAMAMISARAALAGTGVGFVSAEMTRKQIALRWAALLTGIPFSRLKSWTLHGGEIARATYALGVVKTLPLYIDDMGTPTLKHVMTQTRRLVQRHPDVRIVCVDYMTLLQGNAGNSTENYNQVVRSLKRLAKELSIAVIGLVQPDARTVERRGDDEQMPTLADIAWCQEFRNQSDLIITGYRHGKAVARHGGNPPDLFGAFRVAKSRNGGVADWTWSWSSTTMAFDSGCWKHLDELQRLESAA